MRSYGGKATTNRVKRECDKYVQKNIDDIRYELFKDIVQDDFRQAEAVLLYCLTLHGYGTKRIQRMHEWFLAILKMPDLLGKTPTSQDCMKYLNEKYGIDFSEVNVRFESKEQYDKK